MITKPAIILLLLLAICTHPQIARTSKAISGLAVDISQQQALDVENAQLNALLNQMAVTPNTDPEINLSSRLKVVNLKSIQKSGESLYSTMQRVYKSPKTDAVIRTIQNRNRANNVATSQMASANSGARLLAGAGVQNYVNSMYIEPPTPIIETPFPLASQTKPIGNDICTYTAISVTAKTNEIANSHNPIDSNTYPSATVQSKFFTSILAGNSAESLVTIPLTSNTPNIDLLDYFSGEYQNPVNKKLPIITSLKTMYSNIMNNPAIDLYLHKDWCTSDDLDKHVKNWDINTEILTLLGANYVTGTSPSQYKKKVFFFMQIQVMNPVVELAGSGLDTFFNSQLTLTQAQSLTTWGVGNPPGYIKGAAYGMMAVLSADWNANTEAALTLLDSANTIAMTKNHFYTLAKQGSAKFFCKGPAGPISLSAVINGNWETSKLFLPTPPLITPYLYQLFEFKNENFFNFPNQIQYVKSSCVVKPPLKSISLSITRVIGYAPVQVSISSTTTGGNFLDTFYYSDSLIPITYGGYNEPLKVDITSIVGTKGNLLSPKERQVNISFYVDGNENYKSYYGCTGNNCKDYQITYNVDRTTGSITP